jgi:hypothetical protein
MVPIFIVVVFTVDAILYNRTFKLAVVTIIEAHVWFAVWAPYTVAA